MVMNWLYIIKLTETNIKPFCKKYNIVKSRSKADKWLWLLGIW